MRASDDWPMILIAGIAVLMIVVSVFSFVAKAGSDTRFESACYSAGGTPVMSEKGNYCVEKFADMRRAAP